MIIESLTGTDTTFIYTSGTGVLGETGPAGVNESFKPEPLPFLEWRFLIEQQVTNTKHFNGMVIRPGMVYGNGSGPVLQLMFNYGRQNGRMPYVGDGSNKWSAIHIDDLARFYYAAVTHPKAGEIFHAVSDEAISMKELAETINRKLGFTSPVDAITVEEAQSNFPFAVLLPLNIVASNAKAKNLLQWYPQNIPVTEAINQSNF